MSDHVGRLPDAGASEHVQLLSAAESGLGQARGRSDDGRNAEGAGSGGGVHEAHGEDGEQFVHLGEEVVRSAVLPWLDIQGDAVWDREDGKDESGWIGYHGQGFCGLVQVEEEIGGSE